MLVLSDRAPENNARCASLTPLLQMVDRGLSIARIGLDEARRHLDAGQADEALFLLEKLDEDLHLLRRRLGREAETTSPRPPALHGCRNRFAHVYPPDA